MTPNAKGEHGIQPADIAAGIHSPSLLGALRGTLRLSRRTVSLYLADGCGTHAAAIAYYALFSLVPLSLLILSILGLVVDEQRVVNFVFDQLPLQESQFQNVSDVVRRAHDISFAGIGFGILLLIWSGSGIFGAVRLGLNAARHQPAHRAYWRGKLIDVGLIPVFGLLIALSVGLTAITQGVIEQAGQVGWLRFDTDAPLGIVAYALPAAVTFTMFALLYRFVPSGRPNWREALAGATLASVLFEAAKNVWALFFSRLAFNTDTAIYAGFGTALAFLFWTYINATILLLGAEFARALGERTGPKGLDEPLARMAHRY